MLYLNGQFEKDVLNPFSRTAMLTQGPFEIRFGRSLSAIRLNLLVYQHIWCQTALRLIGAYLLGAIGVILVVPLRVCSSKVRLGIKAVETAATLVVGGVGDAGSDMRQAVADG